MKKPTIQEIAEYCEKERKNGIDAEAFFHHYEAIGWVRAIGKIVVPIKKWKSLVVSWERRQAPYKAVIDREKKHEAEKKELAIPRKDNKINIEAIKKLRQERFDIGRDLRGADANKVLMLKGRLKDITKEIERLNDDSMRIGAVISNKL